MEKPSIEYKTKTNKKLDHVRKKKTVIYTKNHYLFSTNEGESKIKINPPLNK